MKENTEHMTDEQRVNALSIALLYLQELVSARSAGRKEPDVDKALRNYCAAIDVTPEQVKAMMAQPLGELFQLK